MDFRQKFQTFLASIATFITRVCPELYEQRSQPEQPRPLPLPHPATASIDIEGPQPVSLPSSPSPSNDYESPQPQSPSPASTHLEPLLAVQNHLQWQNAVLAFCFSYALGVSFQFARTTDQSNHQLPFSLVLLSILVLLTFIFVLVALFIHPNCTRTSQALEKVAFILAAAAFCHTLSIPFSFELKCAIWVVFLLSLLIVMIFTYLNLNPA